MSGNVRYTSQLRFPRHNSRDLISFFVQEGLAYRVIAGRSYGVTEEGQNYIDTELMYEI
jgi:hypothetical protein